VEAYLKAGFVELYDSKRLGVPAAMNHVHVIAKSNGSARLIADVRAGNMFMETVQFTVPNINSVLARPASWAVKFDLSNAFMHF